MKTQKKQPFYVLWGKYYNPVLDAYTERMLGCYKEESNANRMADTLRENRPECEYFVLPESFCD